jgi:23S rRNA (uracil1939-C5)-methyltransferase
MVEFSSIPDGGLPDTGNNVLRAYRKSGDWVMVPQDGSFSEQAGGFKYLISPGCFFQVNTSCAELLQRMVLDLVSGCSTLLDLFGGCGFFSIPAAAGGACVTSIELNPSSSSDGENSAMENGVRSIRFVNGRVRHFLLDTVRSGDRWDAVLVDPPRAGLGVRLSRLLRRIDADIIVYVSCNPFSLARDLGIICERHWQVVSAVPVDMFPQTDHVETVVLIGRRGRK